MNIKNLLKFLPIVMLTTTYTTIGMENNQNINKTHPYNINYNTNNYYAPYTNNTYYGTVVNNNQYPAYYNTNIPQPFYLQNFQYTQPHLPQNSVEPGIYNINAEQNFSNQQLKIPTYLEKKQDNNIKTDKSIQNNNIQDNKSVQNSNTTDNNTVPNKLNFNLNANEYIQRTLTPNKIQEQIFDIFLNYGIEKYSHLFQKYMLRSFFKKLKKNTEKQKRIIDGFRIISKYQNKKIDNIKPIVEQLTNRSCSTINDIFTILNNQNEQKTKYLQKNIRKGMLNSLKNNKAIHKKKEINEMLSQLETQHTTMQTEHDILVFFENFLVVQNYISEIKSKKNRRDLQQTFDDLVKKLNDNKKLFKPINLYVKLIISIYDLLLNSYSDKMNTNNEILRLYYNIYYESSFWKLSKCNTILQNNHNDTIYKIINIIQNNFIKCKKKQENNSKKSNNSDGFSNRFKALSINYNNALRECNSTNSINIKNKEYDLKMIENFKRIKEKYARLNNEINKTTSKVNNKKYLLESIYLIQNDIDKNIALLQQMNPERETQHKKEETSNGYKNLNINKIDSINLHTKNKQEQKIKELEYVNEIIGKHVTRLQENKKKYNNLISKLKSDILNNKINIKDYEQNIKDYFVKNINKNISNIKAIIITICTKQLQNKQIIIMTDINKHIVYTNIIDMYNTTKYFFKYYKILHDNNLKNEGIHSIYSKIHENIIHKFLTKNVLAMACNENCIATNCFYHSMLELCNWEKETTDDIKNDTKDETTDDIKNDTKNKTTQDYDFNVCKNEALNAINKYRTKDIHKIIDGIKNNNNNTCLLDIPDDMYQYLNAVIDSNNKILKKYWQGINEYIPINIISLNHSILQLNILLLFNKEYITNIAKEYIVNIANELLQDLKEAENVIKNLKLVEE